MIFKLWPSVVFQWLDYLSSIGFCSTNKIQNKKKYRECDVCCKFAFASGRVWSTIGAHHGQEPTPNLSAMKYNGILEMSVCVISVVAVCGAQNAWIKSGWPNQYCYSYTQRRFAICMVSTFGCSLSNSAYNKLFFHANILLCVLWYLARRDKIGKSP